MSTIVKTQTELDAALKAGAGDIIIDAPDGAWITLNSSSSHVEAWDSSHVVARGTPRLLACEIDVASMIALGDKCKAQSTMVLYEVDTTGKKIETVEVTA